MKTYTRGNVVVEEIKVGDIHYEYEYNMCVKSEVLTLPQKDDDGCWVWTSKKLNTGIGINYAVNPEHSAYGPKLYDYEAYEGCKFI